MPTSIDPQPKDNEIECGNCGAYFYFGLSRCPNCGVNVYEPEEDLERQDDDGINIGILSKIRDLIRRLLKKPYSAEEVFGQALDQAFLYNDLLSKVGGDHLVVERLVEFEQQQLPEGTRLVWLKNAIERWERDNRSPASS